MSQEEQATGSELTPKPTAEVAQIVSGEERETSDSDEQRIVDLLRSQG